MRHFLLTFTLLCTVFASSDVFGQQQKQKPFKGYFVERVASINLHIDLYAKTVTAPGMELFGEEHGYMNGKDLYGTWIVTSIQSVKENTAELRLSNDLGSETQSVILVNQGDTIYQMTLKGGVSMKRQEGRKLVKLPAELTFKRTK